MRDRVEPNWDLFPHMSEVADYIKKTLECNTFTCPWEGRADRYPSLEEFLAKYGIHSYAHKSLPDGRIQVTFTQPAERRLSNWDESPNVQDTLNAIHAEITEYGFSKKWCGSLKTFDTLKFHLQRMHGYIPFEVLVSGDSVSTQFTVADEKKSMEADTQALLHDLAHWPGQPPVVSINWDMFNSVAVPADEIRKSVERDAHSEVWTGSVEKYHEIVRYLKLVGVVPIDHPHCLVTGHTSVVFGKVPEVIITAKVDGTRNKEPGMSIADIRTKSAVLRVYATDEELRDSFKSNNERLTSQVEPTGLEYHQAEGRCHRSNVKPVEVPMSLFWHRRGQPSIRLTSIESIDYTVGSKFIVLTATNVYELEFKSHKAALEARRLLILKLETI